MKRTWTSWGAPFALLLILAAAGCAAGDHRFVEKPAGFWAGLWHGAIAVITFIISLFNDKVSMYETHNTGAAYNLGFLLGILLVWGGLFRSHHHHRRKSRNRDWDEIGAKIEESIRQGVRGWAEESHHDSEESREIARKIEEKIKSRMRGGDA